MVTKGSVAQVLALGRGAAGAAASASASDGFGELVGDAVLVDGDERDGLRRARGRRGGR